METIKKQFQNFTTQFQKLEPIQLSICLIVLVIGGALSYYEFSEDIKLLVGMYALILTGVVLGFFLWKKAIDRFFSRFIYYITEHKFFRKIIAGGSFSYYQYQDMSKIKVKSKITDPIVQIITLLFAFVGIAVFIFGFLDSDLSKKPIVWGILSVLIPIIATPLIPITWALEDAKVKAWSSGTKTTWMVSKNYKRRFNSIITLGAIFSNLRDSDSGTIVDQIKVMGSVIKLGLLVMLISVGLFILIYYSWFRKILRKKLKTALSLKTYDIILEEIDGQSEEKEITDEISELGDEKKEKIHHSANGSDQIITESQEDNNLIDEEKIITETQEDNNLIDEEKIITKTQEDNNLTSDKKINTEDEP